MSCGYAIKLKNSRPSEMREFALAHSTTSLLILYGCHIVLSNLAVSTTAIVDFNDTFLKICYYMILYGRVSI